MQPFRRVLITVVANGCVSCHYLARRRYLFSLEQSPRCRVTPLTDGMVLSRTVVTDGLIELLNVGDPTMKSTNSCRALQILQIRQEKKPK